MTETLQNILFASEIVADESLFYRGTGAYRVSEQGLILYPRAVIDFFSWYGLFNVETWRSTTTCEHFVLSGYGQGVFQVELWHHLKPNQNYRLAVQTHSSQALSEFHLSVPETIKSGLLSVRVKALENTRLASLSWQGAPSAQPRPVDLGLVMTTFNRQQAALASAQRISRFIASLQAQFSGKAVSVALAVVDNGRNLHLPQLPGVVYIPNPNLGGSGGFARGMYYFKEERKFSHCLFMDDDAACETESLWRSLQLLRFARSEYLAVAGTLLAETPPWCQVERGAVFDHRCKPLGHGCNLRSPRQLLENEKYRPFDYGGWWFFAFPLKHVDYPFPFFVRGDDVHFGLHNAKLQKITLAGISTWGEDFTAKASPMTAYLDMRHHLMQYMLHPTLKATWLTWMRLIVPPVLRSALTMRYATAEAQLLAVQHVLQGPAFWEKNPALENVWPQLRALNEQDKPIDPPADIQLVPFELFHKDRTQNVWKRRLAKLLTLNGHLLPQNRWCRKPVKVDKASYELEAFGLYACVYLATPMSDQLISLRKDRARFFRIVWRMMRSLVKISYSYPALVNAYRSEEKMLTSKSFWEQQFFKRTESEQKHA